MADRVLAQITVAFLLGIMGCEYRNGLVFGLWGLYLPGLAAVLIRRQKTWNRTWNGGANEAGSFRNGQSTKVLFCRNVLPRLGICLAFLLLGFGRRAFQLDLIRETGQRLAEEKEICLVGTICKKEEKNGNFIYDLKNSEIQDGNDGRSCGHVLIYHDADIYSIGEILQVTGTGEPFREARNEGNFNEKIYYYSKNILFRVKAEQIVSLKEMRFPWQEWLYRLRKGLRQVYAAFLSRQEAGVLGVMTLGEKSLLDGEIKELYQKSGISHVLAISGLHVSILGMGLYRFLRNRGISYGISGVVSGLLILAFGQISGMELSTRRAVLMFLILLFGNVLGMAYDSVTALSAAALLQLWENPGSLWQAGFLFSYGAVLAAVVAARIWKDYWGFRWEKRKQEPEGKIRKAGNKVASVLAGTCFLSGCIQLVTLPLTVFFYYEVSVYSVFINCLLLPFMGMTLALGLLGGLAGLLSGLTGFFGFFRGLAAVCFWPVHMILSWNLWVCTQFQKLPFAGWITGKPGLPGLVLYYLLLIVVLWRMQERIRSWERQRRLETANLRRRPDWEVRGPENEKEAADKKETADKRGPENKRKGRAGLSPGRKLLLSSLPAVGLLMLLILRPGRRSRIDFLDVGQGDAVLVRSEDGSSFFLDGGSSSESKVGEYRILSFLKYHGISSIDGWFVSHGDKDHISGLWELWKKGFRIDTLFLSSEMIKDEVWEQLCEQARNHQTKILYLKPGDTVETTTLKWTCLCPGEEEADRNGASLGLLLELSGTDGSPGLKGFFAGDIGTKQEQRLLEKYPALGADLYKASHHGSNFSNGAEFVKQLNPDLTIISCAEKNSYGHPGKEAVARISESGSRILYTMDRGQITVEYREGGMWILPFLEQPVPE